MQLHSIPKTKVKTFNYSKFCFRFLKAIVIFRFQYTLLPPHHLESKWKVNSESTHTFVFFEINVMNVTSAMSSSKAINVIYTNILWVISLRIETSNNCINILKSRLMFLFVYLSNLYQLFFLTTVCMVLYIFKSGVSRHQSSKFFWFISII